MAYNPSTNIVVSGKTFMDVPAVQFKTPDGATVNFAHVGGSIRFSPTLEEQTNNVENFSNAIIDPITSTLLNQLDSDFVAENIKKDVDLFGLVGTLEAGGCTITSGSFTPASDPTYGYTITHGLGKIPELFVCWMSQNFTGTSVRSYCLGGIYSNSLNRNTSLDLFYDDVNIGTKGFDKITETTMHLRNLCTLTTKTYLWIAVG